MSEGPSRPRPHVLGAVVRGTRLVLGAARRDMLGMGAVQVFAGLALLAEVLLARTALAEVLAAESAGSGFGRAAAPILAATGLHLLVLAALAVQAERQRLIAEKAARRATEIVIDVAARVGQDAYDSPGFYDRLARARANALVRPMQFATGLLSALSGAAIVAGVAGALLLLEPLLVVLGLASLPAVVVLARRNTGDTYALALRTTPDDRRRRHIEDVLSQLSFSREVRAYGLAPYLRARFDELYDRRIAAVRRLVSSRTRRAIVSAGATTVTLVGAIAVVSWLLSTGRLELAGAGAALLGLFALTPRVNGLATGLGNLFESAVFLDEIVQFGETWPAAPEPAGSLPAGFGSLELDGVSFAYPGTGRPALSGVSLVLRRGEVVGLAGENGSGKSTLVKLLAGLYPPGSGSIRWDGTELAPEALPSLRDRTSVMFQDFARYELSGQQNIGAGDIAQLDDHRRIHEAAERAGAAAILAALPEGFDTVLSRAFEGGAELSAGQWQRVALARALFRPAPLLILDEPAASLDARAERRLYGEIRRMAADRTVLLVSHRPESLRVTDRVIVMHEGRIVETGTHDELVSTRGRYASLLGEG